MALIRVDREKCKRDGICSDVCAANVLRTDSEGFPHVPPKYESYCIGCGQCVAACPYGALDNLKNPLSGQVPLEGKHVATEEEAAVFLRSRRSIRRYKNKPVPRRLILKLLDMARFAPSGHNSQGISYLVVDDRKEIHKIGTLVVEWMMAQLREGTELAGRFNMTSIIRAFERGDDRIFRNAPALIFATAPKGFHNGLTNTDLCFEYAELFAPSIGLGTCWVGYAREGAREHPAIAEYLGVPEGRVITGILMVGYSKYKFYRLPERNPLDVVWLVQRGDAEKTEK